MIRKLRSWLAAVVLLGTMSLPASAQVVDKDADRDRRAYVPETMIAFLVTVLVLTVVCLPAQRR